MTISFIYRRGTEVVRRVDFTGYSSSGVPQGRTFNHKGSSLVVKDLSSEERKAWARRRPGQTIIEMGVFEAYESVYDHARRLGLIRRPAPPSRLGRGARTVELTFAGDRLPPRFQHQDRSFWSRVLL